MPQRKIKTAAVLGSGVMGSGIAALLAGAGVRTYLLDIVPKDLPKGGDRNQIAAGNLAQALKAKPAAFYSPNDADLVIPGNLEDDLAKLADCDWVIEVVVENLEIKQALMKKVAAAVGPNTIVSSNTSGIDIDAIVDGLPMDFQKRWLGTHFFNPPRYMKLLELIPGKNTSKDVLEFIAAYGRDELGKGIVWAKNTPNFIANRIGAYGMMNIVNLMLAEKFTLEQVDALFGKAMGRPKTAVFKTADLVGIDTLGHVAKNTWKAIPNDPYRDAFLVPEFIEKMIGNKQLGNKTKGGFYKKDGKNTLVIDPATGQYQPTAKTSFPCVDNAKGIEDVAKRIKAVVMDSDDAGAKFAWKATIQTLIYSAFLIPEISDSIVEIDRGMRWGYNWEFGPFETWDAMGVEASVKRAEAEGFKVPGNVKTMLAKGVKTFYEDRADGLYAYDLVKQAYAKVDEDPKNIRLEKLKAQGKVVKMNGGATILDGGDGVLIVQFQTKMNAVDDDIVNILNDAMDIAEGDDKWKGIVIGNHDDAFSAGANLLLVGMQAQQGAFDALDKMVREFQKVNMRLRYSSKPVVAAVGGLALGGGCEIAMHCNHAVLAGETYMGLVEVGVGLLPAGGGTKDLLVKLQSGDPDGMPHMPLTIAQRAFENIATAKVATSGKEVVDAGYLRPWETTVVLNRDHIIWAAKQKVLGLALAGFKPPRPFKIRMGGAGTYAALLVGADGFKKSGFASDHDVLIAGKVAKVLTGGKIPEGTILDEQTVLDFEREGFLALLKEQKTIDRIQHMLMKGKPLRN